MLRKNCKKVELDDDEYVINAYFLEEGKSSTVTIHVSEMIEEMADQTKCMNIIEFIKSSGNMDFFN